MYRRNQAEWAIWHLLDRGKLTSDSAPASVVHTIRRLIDVDRKVGTESRTPHPWEKRHAFIDELPPGRGAEVGYSLENVVALWLGVQFLTLGVPQAEIVRFLRALKPELNDAVRRLHQDYSARIKVALTTGGDAAAKLRQSEFIPAASHVYLLTPTVDHHGVITAAKHRGRPTLSNIRRGRDELLEFVETYASQDKRLVVLEIANAVTSLAYLLARAPVIKRGRPA